MEHNILLIDKDVDEFTFLASVKEYFPELSFQYASNAKDGLIMMQRNRPEFVMLDIDMPLPYGLECLSQIKQNSFLRNLPVIIYTSRLNNDIRKKALNMGASACIPKADSLEELKDIIRKGLKIARYRHAI